MNNFNSVLDEISEEIDWRKSELSKLKEISTHLNQDELKIFLKGCLPLIYAHWEGYVIQSLKNLFQYLNRLELTSEKFCDVYLTTAYEQTLKNLDESKSFEKRKKHLLNIYNNLTKKVSLDTKIDTKANLKFEVLKDICIKTNLNFNKFIEYKEDLNKLVHIRNSISHGENAYTFENFNDIQKYIDLLENLMLDFYSEIEDLLKEKKYLKEANEN